MGQGRCTGHCCRTLDVGPPGAVRLRVISAPEGTDTRDLEKTAGMVIYLGHMVNPQQRTDNTMPLPAPRHWHTCKHFDQNTGDCMDYTNRPAMCRNFPNGRPCPYVECTWDGAK